jgi:hypothetical protein
VQDDFQAPYLRTNDFLKTGLPLTLAAILGISTVGAYLMHVFLGAGWVM